jgi:hypothetical protein
MEAFNVENNEREHGRGSFIPYRPLDSYAAKELCQRLALSLDLDALTTGREVLQVIRDRGVLVEGVSAENETFDLGQLLAGLRLPLQEKLFLNWYRYDRIDEVGAEDLTAHFSDLWYPSVDDLDIFDRSVSWVLSVSHYGAVQFLKMGKG